MKIEWDPSKAASNRAKHGVSFDEAATCLFDRNALAQEDVRAEGKARWVLVGMSTLPRLLTVIYTFRSGDRIRLISARKATRKEGAFYA